MQESVGGRGGKDRDGGGICWRGKEGKSQKGQMKGGMERRVEGKPWKIEGMRWRMK